MERDLMGGGDVRPVARVWTLFGGDLGDQVVFGAVKDEAVPRVEELPGFLGGYGLIDRSEHIMMSIDLWEDQDALAASEPVIDRICEAVMALSGAERRARQEFEVVYSHPQPEVPGAPEPTWLSHEAGRVVMVEGGDLTDPDVLETMVNYQATYLPSVPGCLSALLLLDRTGPTILGLSIWTDTDAAARTVMQTSQLARDVAAATQGSTGSAHVYEVRVNVPMELPFRAPRSPGA